MFRAYRVMLHSHRLFTSSLGKGRKELCLTCLLRSGIIVAIENPLDIIVTWPGKDSELHTCLGLQALNARAVRSPKLLFTEVLLLGAGYIGRLRWWPLLRCLDEEMNRRFYQFHRPCRKQGCSSLLGDDASTNLAFSGFLRQEPSLHVT